MKVVIIHQEWPHPADTASPHSQKVERRRQHGYNQFQNRRHKQLTKVRTRGVTALERSVAKQIATGGLNQVLGVKCISYFFNIIIKTLLMLLFILVFL